MSYQSQDYGYLLGMQGFSEALLHNHFALYNGYVRNTNKIAASLEGLVAEGQVDSLDYAGLMRRLGREYNGMRLHELYFENLGGQGRISLDSPLVEKLAEDFGSYEAWEEDFKTTASMRGIGWAVLYQDNNNGRLNNCWIDEHQVGHSLDRKPLLVLDAWEHSYMLDYGLRRPEYLENFFKNINWNVVTKRLDLQA
jgi:Fe-Mn family superoxide dismutase